MEPNKNNYDQHNTSEYYDNDLGLIKGKISDSAVAVMFIIVFLSIVLGAIGGLLLYLSNSNESKTMEVIGAVLLVVAVIGIHFLAPFIASNFED